MRERGRNRGREGGKKGGRSEGEREEGGTVAHLVLFGDESALYGSRHHCQKLSGYCVEP